MKCPLCGEPHELSQCPRWRAPPDIASAWLQMFAPWIKWNLAVWSLSVRAGAMLP